MSQPSIDSYYLSTFRKIWNRKLRKIWKSKSAIRLLVRTIYAFDSREKGRHPASHDGPFGVHFHQQINEKIDTEIDAEQIRNFEEQWCENRPDFDCFRNCFSWQIEVFEKGCMYENHTNSTVEHVSPRVHRKRRKAKQNEVYKKFFQK